MKTVSKLIAASALAFAAAAPVAAFAQDTFVVPEANTLIERNVHLYTADKRLIVRGTSSQQVVHRGTDAFAYAPAIGVTREFNSVNSQ